MEQLGQYLKLARALNQITIRKFSLPKSVKRSVAFCLNFHPVLYSFGTSIHFSLTSNSIEDTTHTSYSHTHFVLFCSKFIIRYRPKMNPFNQIDNRLEKFESNFSFDYKRCLKYFNNYIMLQKVLKTGTVMRYGCKLMYFLVYLNCPKE